MGIKLVSCKKLYFVIFLLPLFSFGQFEALYKEEVRKTVQLEDSLKKIKSELSGIKLFSDSLISAQQNTIETLENELKKWDKFQEERKETKQLSKDLKSMEEENGALKTKLTEFDKITKDNEKLRSDLEKLKTNKIELANQIKELNEIKRKSEQVEKNQKKLLATIEQRYKQEEEVLFTLGEAIFKSDLENLNLFFPAQKELIKLATNWLTIQNAQLVLANKYDQIAIDKHISQLKSINGINKVSGLIKDLESYHSKNEAIKNLIHKLDKHNEVKVRGTTIELIKEKRKEIYEIIGFELDFNAGIDRTKYVYLNSIIEEIKQLKDDDIDTDVSLLLEKL